MRNRLAPRWRQRVVARLGLYEGPAEPGESLPAGAATA